MPQLVSHEDPFLLLVAWEGSLNAAGAAIVTSPLWARPLRPELLVLALASGLLIDADHTLPALASLSVDALPMTGRPPTHSLAFALAAASGAALATKKPAVGAIIGLGVVSHLLRDASGGGVPYFAYPFEQSSIPWISYPLGLAGLFGLGLIARILGGRKGPSSRKLIELGRNYVAKPVSATSRNP